MFRSVCKIAGIGLCLTVASCSEVVEPIQLTGLSPDATQQEEFEIWTSLQERELSEEQAIDKITDLMEQYYNQTYPLRGL